MRQVLWAGVTGELAWNCHLSGVNAIVGIQVLQGKFAESNACNKTMLLLAPASTRAMRVSCELVTAG